MSEQLFSPSWYRVSRLKPRLRGHTRVYRHEYRGQIWYVLQDHAKGRYYRFSPSAYHLLGRMDGRRDVQELWEQATGQLGDAAPTQSDVVRLLGQLHAADVLLCDVPPDTVELLRRTEKQERAKRHMRMRSPMALKFPLVDPDRFLDRTIRFVRPFFSVFGLVLWLGLVGTATVLAALHWTELTANFSDRVLAAQNLLILWFAYPLVKGLHELGHGYAVKAWGGECHEMGIMLLVLMPVPYVEASAASEYGNKYRRVMVGFAGIAVELVLASVALLFWLALEPGPWRAFAFNVALIGSVSTLLFNGNPLLRFDGYYILADLVEIPNLGQRAMNYLGYLVRRYVFGAKQTPRPYAGPGERSWFVSYAVCAFIYRLFIYFRIILFVAGKFFFIGVILAIWAGYSIVVVPLSKGLRFVTSSPTLREQRGRAVLITVVAIGLALALVFVMPFPSRTFSEGVVWVPDEALVRVGTNGFVTRVVARPDSQVNHGDLLIECREPLLAARVEVLRAKLDELASRHDAALVTDQVQAGIILEEIGAVRANLEREEERVTALQIRSPAEGQFILPFAGDLPDRYLRQGELVAYVLRIDRPTIRVVVPQASVDLVRRRTRGVEVRMSERLDEIRSARIMREVPEAGDQLPATALGSIGGGAIAIDPFAEGGTKSLQKMFQFDLELDEPLEQVFVGGRVYVRFDHGTEPLATQWYRGLRRLFLKRFNV